MFHPGLRDPNKRKEAGPRNVFAGQTAEIQYNGAKMVRITGCDYKLPESEILDWLGLFGDIVSEITEEIYGDQNEPDCKGLPQVGNCNYLVRMRLSKDLPNFMPIYGRRVCLEYRGGKNNATGAWVFT